MNSNELIKKGIIYERIIHDGYHHQPKIHVEICSTLPGKSDRSRNGFLGMGTASSSILDYMGLEDDEKSICFHFVTEATWKKVKKGLQNQLRIDVPEPGLHLPFP